MSSYNALFEPHLTWLITGPIEKGANDGQQTYANDLVKALKAGVGSRARAGTVGSKLKKGKRRKGEGDAEREPSATDKATDTTSAKPDPDWGVLEPLHGILGPVFDPISSMISSNMIIGLLVFLLLISWFRGPKARHASSQIGFASMTSPERVAAYEEIWRTEESELWKWLEDRMGMVDASYPPASGYKSPAQIRTQRDRHLRSQGFKARIADEGMEEREVEHAIRVTEEKLDALKAAVQKKRRRKEGEVDEEGQASSGEDPGPSNDA